jgi:CRISPR/Cas system-associated exonuclease Cas4 (RecB family)
MSRRMEKKTADHELDFEYLYHLSKVISRSRKLLLDYPYITSLKSLRKVLFQVLDMSRLPFYGEPLKGLQVMGVLETRAIDFENLVVLSVNEGILPSGRSSNSFIPFDIKQVFGLPTFQQRDAVFAYHFYRMLQRAKNIYLLYDTEGDMMKGGEKSRFITQLSYELGKVNGKIRIREELLSPNPPATGASNAISMPKTARVMQSLREKCLTGFSPSALNLYIRCPLQFYFQEIIGLSETEEIEETIESKTLGTVIHDVLFKVYQPFIGSYIRPEQLVEQLKLTDDYLKASFHEHYRDGDIQHGKNHLAYKVSLFLINQLIRSEAEALLQEHLPAGTLRIEALEVKLESRLECKTGAETLQVRIKGKADRIDRWADTIRVIDYKTGSVKPEELRVKSWDTLTSDPAMAKAFQLLVYACLYQDQYRVSGGQLRSGNISLRKISEGVMEVKLPENTSLSTESLDIFKQVMTGLMEEILDPAVPFDQTEDLDICAHCAFRTICCR